jgi:hypothetical protein
MVDFALASLLIFPGSATRTLKRKVTPWAVDSTCGKEIKGFCMAALSWACG